jgi:hypothetical protein
MFWNTIISFTLQELYKILTYTTGMILGLLVGVVSISIFYSQNVKGYWIKLRALLTVEVNQSVHMIWLRTYPSPIARPSNQHLFLIPSREVYVLTILDCSVNGIFLKCIILRLLQWTILWLLQWTISVCRFALDPSWNFPEARADDPFFFVANQIITRDCREHAALPF